MPTIFDFLYREYCRARLAEMRKQLLLVSARSYEIPEVNAISVMLAPLLDISVLATISTKLATFIEPERL